MFRRWLDLIGCRVYGHHWWVVSGVDAETNEDESLDVFLSISYGECKRCGTSCPDADAGSWRTHSIFVDDYKLKMDKRGSKLDVTHKVEVYELTAKSRIYGRKETS